MNVRRIILLMVALIAAGGTALVARKFVNSPQGTRAGSCVPAPRRNFP